MKDAKNTICAILVALVVTAEFAGAATLFVPGQYKTIQAAVDSAIDGDTVIVADGIYSGDGNRDIDFGGKTISVRSENGPENCIIDCQGLEAEPHRGFYLRSGEGPRTTIEGLTIINGYGGKHGGGLCFQECSPTVINCRILKNTASTGGGVACYAASPIITNCVISTNTASFRGGGIYCMHGDSATITGCTISNNSAKNDGGGIKCSNIAITITDSNITGNSASRGGGLFARNSSSKARTSVKLENCVIAANSASQGGGLYCSDCNGAKITYCAIIGNSGANGAGLLCMDGFVEMHHCDIIANLAYNHGGGIRCHSRLIITNSTISGNSSKNHTGGGMWCYGSRPVSINNCIISGNLAKDSGGGIECIERSSVKITNCTLSHNRASRGAGIYCTQSSSATITNCIVWANENTEVELDSHSRNTALITYSDIKRGWKGEGNIDSDPLFVMDGPDAIRGNWTQQPSYDPNTNCTTLTDAHAKFVKGEMVGLLIQLGSTSMKHAFITGNTATSVEVLGDLRTDVSKGDGYKLVEYHIRSGSPCINAGTTAGAPETDIDGADRNSKPDIGAFEGGY
ncbi:MAG: right-handed parallel beta-helix repeat-containing protein [Planctomycetota bacterium]